MLPNEIEKKSFEIISKELEGVYIDKENENVIKRVIHTTADFDYVKNLCFSKDVVKIAVESIKKGVDIITDTQMTKSGINKKILSNFGGNVHCFMSDDDVYKDAQINNTTRAVASMNKLCGFNSNFIVSVGNAPTALIRLYELIKEKKIFPKVVIGVPVGFVNVIESKELIMKCNVPFIVAKGRKGGSNVAAAICNALIYDAFGRKI